MTLAHGTDRLESARLVLRRVAPDDLPFFTRIHALPEVVQYLGQGRPRSPEKSAAWLRSTLASYEQLALGQLAVLRKEDGALIGRCGLMDLVVEAATPEHGIRRGWFGRAQAPPAGVALTYECELGYTFDPAAWGQGFATEAAGCVRDYARDVLRLSYAVSVIHPQNARSRRVAERSGARAAGQMEVVGLTWDRYVWSLATGGRLGLEQIPLKRSRIRHGRRSWRIGRA
jgi:RimJ/RimL family protein N-acetyltransferase